MGRVHGLGESVTTIYSVSGMHGIGYYPTKAEALRVARADRVQDEHVQVQRHRVTTRLRPNVLYASLLNGQSWCDETQDVPLR
jgi:hypothetical protein